MGTQSDYHRRRSLEHMLQAARAEPEARLIHLKIAALHEERAAALEAYDVPGARNGHSAGETLRSG